MGRLDGHARLAWLGVQVLALHALVAQADRWLPVLRGLVEEKLPEAFRPEAASIANAVAILEAIRTADPLAPAAGFVAGGLFLMARSLVAAAVALRFGAHVGLPALGAAGLIVVVLLVHRLQGSAAILWRILKMRLALPLTAAAGTVAVVGVER